MESVDEAKMMVRITDFRGKSWELNDISKNQINKYETT